MLRDAAGAFGVSPGDLPNFSVARQRFYQRALRLTMHFLLRLRGSACFLL